MVTFPSVAETPKITNHPQDFKDVVPGTPVNFTITTTGTEPLSTDGSGSQLERREGVRSGSCVTWRDLKLLCYVSAVCRS